MRHKRKYFIRASVYDKRGKLLAQATNSYKKTHPKQARYASAVGKPQKVFLHAEIAAIIKAQKFGESYKIFIERYKSDGSPATAEPCNICKQAIKEAGIQRVEYTVG